ncbi:hypothetical protein LTR66_009572 [Elasticomyces elasticus]|nr:hypothetical protein LTR66_009572 [Elasticomyces elasticus]
MPPASYSFEDLSGIQSGTFENPYDALIEACNNDPIQARYTTHRTTRATQQKAKLLSPDFTGLIVDPILKRLEDPTIEPGFTDPRHCLVFWARPPQQVKELIGAIQQKLLTAAPRETHPSLALSIKKDTSAQAHSEPLLTPPPPPPDLWLMPSENLHMTALEITHSLTAPEIAPLITTLRPSIPALTEHTLTHRARLIKPLLSYDAQALALSYVPAARGCSPPGRTQPPDDDDAYSYHHLRRDLHALATRAGVQVQSRYVVPSAHLTIARFVEAGDFEGRESGRPDREKIEALVGVVEEVNRWLEAEYWPGEGDGRVRAGGEWIVGEEKGLDCREGALWYGGGTTVGLGRGF